ncbi:TPA: transcriptional regulator [Vibrio vulnificus]
MMAQREDIFALSIGEDGKLEKDDGGAKVYFSGGKSFSITVPESYILKKLIEEDGKVVEKNELICAAWGRADVIGPNSLPVAITNLRKILGFYNIKITNVPKRGYRIDYGEKTNGMLLDESKKNNKEVQYGTLKARRTVFAIFFMLVSLYAIAYIWFSWVHIECKVNSFVEVCHVKGDTFDPSLIDGKTAGLYYYSTSNGMVKVESHE